MIFDSVGYELLGKQLSEEGWTKYFETGPNREPLYLAIIAFSMKLETLTHISYLNIQRFLQVLIFLISLLLTSKLLRLLKIREWIICVLIFYMGISPAMINSVFSLFSEIATYPFVLGIILVSAKAWLEIEKISTAKLLYYGCALGLLFIGVTFTKALFEYILVFFLLSFFALSLHRLWTKRIKEAVKIFSFSMIVLILFCGAMHQFKMLNQKYNGTYVFSNRKWLILGNTERRTEKFDSKRFLTAMAYVPGEGVCHRFFKVEDCYVWGINYADLRGFKLRKALSQENNDNWIKFNKEMTWYVRGRILDRPFTYMIFYALESFKIPFWESTHIGGVKYPSWLERLYDKHIFKNGLRLIVAVSTFLSFVYSLFFLWRKRENVFSSDPDVSTVVIFCVVSLILVFTAFHALIQIIPRYVFSIVPLFIALIGLMLDRLLYKTK